MRYWRCSEAGGRCSGAVSQGDDTPDYTCTEISMFDPVYIATVIYLDCDTYSSLTCIECLLVGPPSLTDVGPDLADWQLHSHPSVDHALASVHSPTVGCRCGRSRNPMGF